MYHDSQGREIEDAEMDNMRQSWRDIEAQAKVDLEAIATDQDAYAFIGKYLSRDLRGRYLAIYRSDRQEMNRSPKEAIESLLSLPPLE